MKANQVRTTLLSARGKRKWQQLLEWSSCYPGKIAPLIRSKGEHFRQGGKRYFKMISRQLDAEGYIGAAEILIYHAQKGSKAPRVVVGLSDRRFTTLLNASKRRGWPVIIHIEFAALKPEARKEFLGDLNRLLGNHPGHDFVLIQHDWARIRF